MNRCTRNRTVRRFSLYFPILEYKVHCVAPTCMNNIFRDLIRFSYLMQSPLLAHVNYLGLNPTKHRVIFSKCGFFNFRAKKKLYSLYLERREY
jgi:hypothetical protein